MKKRFNYHTKKSFKSIFILLFFFGCQTIDLKGQSTAKYAFTTNATSTLATDKNGNTIDMSTGTISLIGPNNDQFASPISNIGFTFIYMGNRYSQFSASPNGFIQLGSKSISVSDLTSCTETAPCISPFCSDLATGSNGRVNSKLIGTTPNRCLVIEFNNMSIFWNYLSPPSSFSNDGTYQVRLYETTGVIEFVYGSMKVSSINAPTLSPMLLDTTPSVGFYSGATDTAFGYINYSNNTYTTTGTFSSNPIPAVGTLTALNSSANGARRLYRFTPRDTIPSPTNLNFSGVSMTGMTLDWLAPTPSSKIVKYEIYNSTDNINFTFFNFVKVNTNSFIATGLSPNTNYYWKIIPVGEGVEGIGLTGSQATPPCNFAPTISINGASAVSGVSYPTLTSAIADMKVCGITQPTILELDNAYSSVSETYPIALSTILGASATNTITIRPASGVTGKSITSTNTTATINVDGGDYWKIDGRPGGTGTRDLSIGNTGTAPAIQFVNDASYNVVKYCTISSNESSTSSGVIFFSTTTGTTGNDNDTIDNCDVKGVGTVANTIYAAGTTTTPSKNNNNIVISNNQIRDFFAVNSSDWGINISTGNSEWTISNNSFYQTVSQTSTGITTDGAIKILNSSGSFNILNNYIGGSTINAGGVAWKSTSTNANVFKAISLNVSPTVASVIQGNTIANMIFKSASNASTAGGTWCGIYLNGGNANIIGNTIGSTTGTGSILDTITGSIATSYGIFVETPTGTTVNISKNSIGSINVSASTTSKAHSFTGISTAGVTNLTIDSNIIGSTTTANSINASTSATTPAFLQIVSGIVNTASATTLNITNNTIANLNNAYSPSTPINRNILRGIVSLSGVNNITNNTIRDLSAIALDTGVTFNSSVIGIVDTSNTAGQTISQNTIYSLKNINSSANAVGVIGIYYNGATTGTNVISRNLIYNIHTSTTAPKSFVYGIHTNKGTSTFQNNMIRLGIEGTIGIEIRGINDLIGTNNYYFNTVYIGGTPTTNGANSFAFNSSVTSNTRNFQNNIFINSRSNNGSTGKHYSISLAGTSSNPAGLTCSNNIYQATGTGGILGLYNATDIATLSGWKTSVGLDAGSLSMDPLLLDPIGTTPNLHINPNLATAVERGGFLVSAVTEDFDGEIRSALSPVDIGADAGDFKALEPIFSNMASSPSLVSKCTKTNRTISIDITSPIGTVTGAILNYSHNGIVQTPITMTNTSGTVWSGTILAPTINVNATVTWSITATNSLGFKATYYGISYSDEPNTGFPLTSTASPSTFCAGTSTILSIDSNKNGTIVLGSGISTSNASGVSPFYHGHGGVKSQYIIKSSELTALGFIKGTISAVGINITALGTPTLNQFSISMGNTNQVSAISNSAIVTGLTEVYSNTAQGLSLGLNTFNFSSVFNWDGTSNVVLSICYSNNNLGGLSSSVSVDTTADSTSMAIYSNSISNASSCLIPAVSSGQSCMTGLNSNSISSIRPMFSFTVRHPLSTFIWSDGTSTIGTTNPLSITSSVSKNYTCSSTVSGCPITSSSISTTVNPLPAAPIVTLNSTQCGVGIPSTVVADTNGFTAPLFKWYPTSSGGVELQSDTTKNYKSPISSTTSLYISVANPTSGCESLRTLANIIVRNASTNATIASSSQTGAVEQCTENGWTYYATPSDSDKWLFAIYKNGNILDASVDILVNSGPQIKRSSSGLNQGHSSITMARSWNVTPTSFSGSNPMKVRFFHTTQEITDVQDSATVELNLMSNPSYQYSNTNAVSSGLQFIKTSNIAYNPANWVGNTYPSTILKLPFSSSNINGVTYTDLDSIFTFSGGTGGIAIGSPSQGGVGNSSAGSIALPVTWNTIVATAKEDGNLINWSTASEKNTNYFEVEYSYDAKNFFKASNEIKAAGNSTIIKSYDFMHFKEYGELVYYRIKQVDLDGKTDYSKAVVVSRTSKLPEFNVSMYPVPLNVQDLSIKILTVQKTDISISINDLLGRNVYTETISLAGYTTNHKINLSHLPKGTYQVIFNNTQYNIVKKLVIQK